MPENTEKTLSEEFSAWLLAKRLAMGWDQKTLAMKAYGDVRRESFISQIETGKRKVTVATMEVLLKTLNSWVEFIE